MLFEIDLLPAEVSGWFSTEFNSFWIEPKWRNEAVGHYSTYKEQDSTLNACVFSSQLVFQAV